MKHEMQDELDDPENNKNEEESDQVEGVTSSGGMVLIYMAIYDLPENRD
jgi:hypothetical protein